MSIGDALRLSSYLFDSLTIWIQVHDIPINLLSPKIATNLLDGMGFIHPIDPLLAAQWKYFARVKVTVKTSIKLKAFAQTLLDTGKLVIAQLKYERLLRFCVICCSLGHEMILCPARQRIQHVLINCTDEDMKNRLTASIAPKINNSIRVSSSAAPIYFYGDTRTVGSTCSTISTIECTHPARTVLANSGSSSKVSQ